MKIYVCLPVTIFVSVALMGVVKVRRKDHDKEGKHTLMENIKLRVTTEVLDEYVNERLKREKEEESSHDHIKTLEEEVKILQVQAEKAKAEADKCQAEQKIKREDTEKVETLFKELHAGFDTEKAAWTEEIESLKKKLAAQSPVCGFLKDDSQGARDYCMPGAAPPKKVEPKPEEPKKEEPKPEPPKAEEPKPEEPKKEEPKPEPPKAEEPKPEPPKAEEPKPEPPKAEEPKPEPPKAEEPKAEEPKKEEPKAEQPNAR